MVTAIDRLRRMVISQMQPTARIRQPQIRPIVRRPLRPNFENRSNTNVNYGCTTTFVVRKYTLETKRMISVSLNPICKRIRQMRFDCLFCACMLPSNMQQMTLQTTSCTHDAETTAENDICIFSCIQTCVYSISVEIHGRIEGTASQRNEITKNYRE